MKKMLAVTLAVLMAGIVDRNQDRIICGGRKTERLL